MTAQEPPRAVDRRPADRLLRRIVRRGGGGWTARLVLVSVVLAVTETVLPAVLGHALDAVLTGTGATGWIITAAALVTVVALADALDDLAAGMSNARATAWLRHGLLRHVLALGTRGTRRFSGGDLATRLVSNAALAGRVPMVAVWTVTAVVPAAGAVVALALIDPWLCLTTLVALPLLARLARAFLRDASELADRYLRVQAVIADRLLDAVGGARTIAAADTAGREVRRVLAPLPELHRHGMDMWRVQTRASAQQAVLVPLLEVAVLAVAGFLLLHGRITPGELLAASQYVVLAAGLGAVVTSLGGLARARSAAGLLVQVFDEPPPAHGDEPLPPGPGRLDLRAVTVRGADRPALDGIDLTVSAGASVAVVGRSGSGKSLLAALAARLVDPDEGEVALDGVPLPHLRRAELRRAIGVSAARPVLIGDTVADVIGLGAPGCSAEQVRAAARAARADGFIRGLPEGYGTPLTEAPMSGGEAQRIGLARAFVRAGRLLVLDDVAASLDTATEHHIGEVLRTSLADRTRLVVAHRAATAARADLVVWLDEGRLRGCAPHTQLWHDPDYRAVFAPDPEPAAAVPDRAP